jgi:hypothetical protein
MDQIPQHVRCGSCGTLLQEPVGLPDENRKPCPCCGSMTRQVDIDVAGTLEFHDMLSMKEKDAARKTLVETKAGDDLERETGKWMRKQRIIDHSGDRYKEHIVDPESGRVVRDVDEPLSAHRGHGSAKFKK